MWPIYAVEIHVFGQDFRRVVLWIEGDCNEAHVVFEFSRERIMNQFQILGDDWTYVRTACKEEGDDDDLFGCIGQLVLGIVLINQREVSYACIA